MIKLYSTVFSAVLLSACAGLNIDPITVEKAQNAHQSGSKVEGYIVYQPMLVMEIAEKTICVSRAENGECMEFAIACGIGEPTTLPDYSKPYLLKSSSGFGKAGVEINIDEGWKLTSLKDNSDNTGFLDILAAVGGVELSNISPTFESKTGCSKAGIYRASFEKSEMTLTPLIQYYQP
ncbi:hypothetical protein [Marinobacter sp.]|uniref:hypothetical protein n=1 Tax=Marinobacter sp. TaxID=50741 RepID=UPI002357F80C|nr:hypothetical protein [Marinobacter sp.]